VAASPRNLHRSSELASIERHSPTFIKDLCSLFFGFPGRVDFFVCSFLFMRGFRLFRIFVEHSGPSTSVQTRVCCGSNTQTRSLLLLHSDRFFGSWLFLWIRSPTLFKRTGRKSVPVLSAHPPFLFFRLASLISPLLRSPIFA